MGAIRGLMALLSSRLLVLPLFRQLQAECITQSAADLVNRDMIGFTGVFPLAANQP